MAGRAPGIVLRIKAFTTLPDGKDQVQQLAHHMADSYGFFVGMLGDHARVEGSCRRVVTDGTERSHPQVAADQVVAAPAHDVAARPARLTVAIDTAGY